MARKKKAKSKKRSLKPFAIKLGTVFLLPIMIIVLIVVLMMINPNRPGIYMSQEYRRLGQIEREWIALDAMSKWVAPSAVAAEDANFCLHGGIDWDALEMALSEGGDRGASTITQQVSKNLYLWHGRSYVRKGLEAVFALTTELVWSKEQILEAYLNIAEFDEGVFGIEAAANHYFNKPASTLSQTEAARLAAILPSPKTRSASRPSSFVRRRASQIIIGAETILLDGRAGCFTQT